MTTDATRARHIDPERLAAWAERLAAWADHGLPADESAAVELHLSQCAHCQEVLAAFARSAPTTAVVMPFWTQRPVQWSAGLAAAAALVLVVWMQRPPNVSLPESTVAMDLSAGVQPAPVSPAPPPPSPAPAPVAESPRVARRSVAPPPRAEAAQPAAPPPALTMPPPTVVFATPPPAQSVMPPPPPVMAPPPPPPPATVMAQRPAVTLPIPAAPPSVPARQTAMDAFSAEMVILTFEVVAPAPAPPGAAGGAARAAGRGGGRGAMSLLPTVPTRWRIVGGKQVERSSDAGTTWLPTIIDPPSASATVLTTGAASSQTVCWLVGRDGLVLVTADGVTFRRVSIPEPVNLIGVTAEGALRALVTAADGRVFETIDAGATWRVRTPNVPG